MNPDQLAENCRRVDWCRPLASEHATQGCAGAVMAILLALVLAGCHPTALATTAAPPPIRDPNLVRAADGRFSQSVQSRRRGVGYGADTIDVSLKMGELSLLPAVRQAAPDTIIVADGTSCRGQIRDGAGRQALHVARVLAMSVKAAQLSADG
jgi:hypothetical protein